MRKKIHFLIFSLAFGCQVVGAETFDRKGVICFEMGSEVAFFFINGKVIRYSAFHMFEPPVELQKKLYGKYKSNGRLLEWRDDSTKVRFSLDLDKLRLAANNNWGSSSSCEEHSLSEIKEFFQPILERNRRGVR